MGEAEEKEALRRRVLVIRDGLSAGAVAAMSGEIVRRLTALSEIRAAATLMVYLGFGSEVMTEGLIRWAWSAGKRVVVPLCAPGRCLIPCRIEGFEEVEAGHYGIREPKAVCRRPVEPGGIDAVVVPAVAFDRRGGRVGYGGGYYDRFLPRAPQAARIGAAFAVQIVAAVPAGGLDVPMDMVVTEEGTIPSRAIRLGR